MTAENGHRVAGTPWIIENAKPWKQVSVDDFPRLSEEWMAFMHGIRKEIFSKCDECTHSTFLCRTHELAFEWMACMARANIPARYWPLEIENSKVTDQKALNFVRQASDNVAKVIARGLGFSIFGGRGRGKTTLTIYFLKSALRAGYPGYFILMESLVGLIKDSFDDPEARKRFDSIRNTRVLVLDDIGTEYIKGTGFVSVRLEELLRTRDAMGLVTLFSSILNGKQFKSRYGEGVRSLLTNTNKPIAINGDTLRSCDDEWGEVCPK